MSKPKARSKIFETRYFGFIIGVGVFFIFIMFTYGIGFINNFERNFLDFRFNLKQYVGTSKIKVGVSSEKPNPNVSEDILIIGIDEKSLDEFGKWPFPRSVEANLINTFARIKDQTQRERAIFLDINFIEKDTKAPENDVLLIDSIRNNGKVFLESFFHPIDFVNNEIAKNHIERQEVLFENSSVIKYEQIGKKWKSLVTWRSVEAPLKPYGKAAYQYGNVTFNPDPDKIFRRVPLISRFSIPVGSFIFDDLTEKESIDQENFERFIWEDSRDRFHEISFPLNSDVLQDTKLELEKIGQKKDEDLDGDGVIDKSYYIIYKYKDYIIPSMTLSLVLEYFNVALTEIKVELGKYLTIPNPQKYDPETKKWEGFTILPAVYKLPAIIDSDKFKNEIAAKLTDSIQRRRILNIYKLNKIFNKYILEEEITPKNLAKAGKILKDIGLEDVKLIKDTVYKEEINIPIDPMGRMLINYIGRRSSTKSGINTFKVRSFSGYTKDPGPDPTNWVTHMGVSNKILIAGMFATGLADEKQTPFGLMFGPEVIANSVNTILKNKFLIKTPIWIDIFILFFIIIIVSFLCSRLKTILSLILSLVVIIVLFIINVIIFYYYDVIIIFVAPVFSVLVTFISIVVYRVMTEEREKKKIKNMFGKYVSPTVVDRILENPPELGGVDKELTVFFSDIRGFTTLSERMTPQALVNHLNIYLTAMTDIILEYKGTLDKYVGDEIMCFWGAPLPQSEHAYFACQCALKQMEVLRQLNEEWPPEKRINIGIGLNSGIMTVGNMGSQGRMNYTLMGDNVNLGARLEGTNKQYLTNIIISEYTYGLVKDQVFVRELDNIRVKGKNKPVLIYELIDM